MLGLCCDAVYNHSVTHRRAVQMMPTELFLVRYNTVLQWFFLRDAACPLYTALTQWHRPAFHAMFLTADEGFVREH